MFKCFKDKKEIKQHKLSPKAKTLVLIVGHTRLKKGAKSYNGHFEYDVNLELAFLISGYAEVLGLETHVILRDGIGIAGAYKAALKLDPFCICELHFNAFNTKVSGCEVLYSDVNDRKPKQEKRLAQMALDTIHIVLGNNKRGLKHIPTGSERGFYNLSRVCEVPSILIEPYFGDNKTDFDNYIEKKEELAEELAWMFEDFRLTYKE